MSAAADEKRQLEHTVQALRDELERLRVSEQERLDGAGSALHAEVRQLRDSVRSLRDEMERLRIAGDERDALHQRALRDAEAHVTALRDQLEAARARRP